MLLTWVRHAQARPSRVNMGHSSFTQSTRTHLAWSTPVQCSAGADRQDTRTTQRPISCTPVCSCTDAHAHTTLTCTHTRRTPPVGRRVRGTRGGGTARRAVGAARLAAASAARRHTRSAHARRDRAHAASRRRHARQACAADRSAALVHAAGARRRRPSPGQRATRALRTR